MYMYIHARESTLNTTPMWRCNTFDCIYVCVCPVLALTFQKSWPRNFILVRARASSEYPGQAHISRSSGQGQYHICVLFVASLPSTEKQSCLKKRIVNIQLKPVLSTSCKLRFTHPPSILLPKTPYSMHKNYPTM